MFADLGLEEPAIELAKAELERAITGIIDVNGWTQEVAARQMGIDQPQGMGRGRATGRHDIWRNT